MLRSLYVKDFAIVGEAEITFADGCAANNDYDVRNCPRLAACRLKTGRIIGYQPTPDDYSTPVADKRRNPIGNALGDAI